MIAVEPVLINVRALGAHVCGRDFGGVYPKGLSNVVGEFTMWTYPNSALDSFVLNRRWESDVPPTEVQLPLTTLDLIVEELDLTLDFIKLDIEGAERQALEGGAQTIRRDHPRVVVALENLDDDIKTIPQVIRRIDPAFEMLPSPCIFGFDGSVIREVGFFRKVAG